MKYKTKYLNYDEHICDDKPDDLNYGRKHFNLNNEASENSSIIEYESISGSLYKRDIKLFTKSSQKVMIFINFIATMRILFLSNRKIKRVLLLQKFAFKETGTAVKTNKDIDTLFVYSFIHKFAQIEIYMSTCETGVITELNYYHQMESLEIRIPLSFEGISYIFEQIFEDFYQVSMSDLNLNQATAQEKSLINSIMQFDIKIDEIDNIDIYEAIDGIIQPFSYTVDQQIKQEVDRVLDNDLILKYINSQQNPIIIKLFDLIDLEISSIIVAKQFVLEELSTISKGNIKEQEFVETSGLVQIDYIDALSPINSSNEVHAVRQLMSVLEDHPALKDRNNLADIRIEIIDMIMKKYKIGKYEALDFENIRYTLENQESKDLMVDVYEHHLVLIDRLSHEQYKFEQVYFSKYYNKVHGYITINKSRVNWTSKEKQKNQKFDIVKIEIISERSEFNHIYENERAKEFLYIMEYATEIETLLESRGASGKGMHSKLTSIEYNLDKEIIKRIRRIATIRNKKMHLKGFSNYVFSDYEDDCKIVIDYLGDI